ncbi:hypothetical protein, partial [Arthrobacter sp. BF1]|uniref:hypothetical protein n=1 Tax=Arthrobacter sp. BF1 TaxID=2821145 RepID=UPI001C4E3BAE
CNDRQNPPFPLRTASGRCSRVLKFVETTSENYKAGVLSLMRNGACLFSDLLWCLASVGA